MKHKICAKILWKRNKEGFLIGNIEDYTKYLFLPFSKLRVQFEKDKKFWSNAEAFAETQKSMLKEKFKNFQEE